MQRKMEREIPLPGGRVTAGVVLSGDRVHLPPCANANFVHAVLQHLEMKNCPLAPRYIGLDERGREMLTYLPGDCPADLEDFSDEQCGRAMKILRSLHQELADFPGCLEGETVCHYDPSPCNFVFQDGLSCAHIDWDAAGIGDPADDLAYAVWMRLDHRQPGYPAGAHGPVSAGYVGHLRPSRVETTGFSPSDTGANGTGGATASALTPANFLSFPC